MQFDDYESGNAELASVIHHNCYQMRIPEPTKRLEIPMELEVPTTGPQLLIQK